MDKEARSLSQRIMNMVCRVKRNELTGKTVCEAYSLGHRDARHRAAELSAEAVASRDELVRELSESLQCAQNVLTLLKPELESMGAGASRVLEKVNAALSKARQQ